MPNELLMLLIIDKLRMNFLRWNFSSIFSVKVATKSAISRNFGFSQPLLKKYSSLRGNITTKKRRKQIYIIPIKIHPLESERVRHRAKTTCALNNLNDDRGWLLLSSLSRILFVRRDEEKSFRNLF